MGIVDNMQAAGFKAEKSTYGDKLILEGLYKASLYHVAYMEDKGYGESIYAQFKVQETLSGKDSVSSFPEFSDYYNCSPEKINSRRNGLKKLLDGLFSVGVEVDNSSDDKLLESLKGLVGTVVFVKAYKKTPVKKLDDGTWAEDPDGDPKQGFTFLTEKNAMKLVKKAEAPF